MMKLTALKIDPEFQGKIPPLTFEELEQLEKNIVNDGKVINPIIVWKGLVVDGHNRYAILQKHPDIPYTIHEKEFADRFEAIIWICKINWGGVTSHQNRKNTLLESVTSLKRKRMEETVIISMAYFQRRNLTKIVKFLRTNQPENVLLKN